ncbi:UvrD-helicase domain-containing protein [bacterium]|nr:UvrD-helicase domain-containing protein [bacterium]
MTVVLVAVLMVAACAFALILRLRHLKRRLEKLASFNELIERFEERYAALQGAYLRNSDVARVREDFSAAAKEIKSLVGGLDAKVSEKHRDFLDKYAALTARTRELNISFVEKEKEECARLFENVDGRPLTVQQREAVICDEDNNLVVAGAGSGKTLTIIGKAKYLLERKKIRPQDILLISFARKNAGEMTERLKRNGIETEACTFHKLGLDIITEKSGERPDVLDENDQRAFLENFFSDKISKLGGVTLQNLITFFGCYLTIPGNVWDFDSLGRQYEYERRSELETLKSKYLRAKAGKYEQDKRTLQGEFVKSREEVQIANFLFLHGVEYEYESLYPHLSEEDTRFRKAYRPDFYLSGYDIYLEHFGVDREGRAPQLSRAEELKYQDGMKWKRELHARNNTKLLETYSWYTREGILLEMLEKTLREAGVQLKEPDPYALFEKIFKDLADNYYREFIKLCGAFLRLFKSMGFGLEDLESLDYKSDIFRTPFFKERLRLFKSIMSPMLSEYEAMLKSTGKVDFSDMINRASGIIASGEVVRNYKYVIVDEYQDISMARFRLLKNIVEKSGAILFCVGDDWQSIYRFTGSDLWLFRDFAKYFGATCLSKLEETFRCPQELSDAAQSFVLKNAIQWRKQLTAQKHLKNPLRLYLYKDSQQEAVKEALDDIIRDFGPERSILILGRTNYDEEQLLNGLFEKQRIGGQDYLVSPEYQGMTIQFMTVHKAKGLEADNVIIVNFNNSAMGFPNQLSDDPVLELVLTESDQHLYAEERRLLYVALTRSRNRVYLIANKNCPSEFVPELQRDNYSPDRAIKTRAIGFEEITNPLKCPRCKTGNLIPRLNQEKNLEFVGCSNYPRCDFSVNRPLADLKYRCSCGGFLLLRQGKNGPYYGCSNYPVCRRVKKYLPPED